MNLVHPMRPMSLLRGCLGLAICAAAACRPAEPRQARPAAHAGDEDVVFPDEAEAARPPRHEASAEVAEAERVLAAGDVPRATELLRAVVARDGEDPRARLDLGLALELRNHYDEAEAEYRAALELDPDFAEAATNLGLLLRDRERLEEALPLLSHAVEVEPAMAEGWVNLALALEDAGQPVAALDAYHRALHLEPDAPAPRVNMALLLVALDRRDEASVELRRAMRRAAGDPALLSAIGNGLRRVGQAEAAVRALTMAVEAREEGPTPALLAELGAAQAAAGLRPAAQATLERALSLDAHYATAHYMLAGLLAAQGSYDEAATHYEAVLRDAEGSPLAARARERLAAARRAAGP